jgi:hypothetical protein
MLQVLESVRRSRSNRLWRSRFDSERADRREGVGEVRRAGGGSVTDRLTVRAEDEREREEGTRDGPFKSQQDRCQGPSRKMDMQPMVRAQDVACAIHKFSSNSYRTASSNLSRSYTAKIDCGKKKS